MKEMRMYDVTAIGELLIDFTPISADTRDYPAMAANPGGAPSNFLAALAAYGAKTALLGKVGADVFGEMLIRSLDQAGVETAGIVTDPTVFTTLAFITLDSAGERSFSFARKPGADMRLRFEELNLSLIDRSKIFHFGTLSLTDQPARSATRKAVEYAKTGGKLVTFDPNIREPLWSSLDEARKQALWGVARSDVVKLSSDEAGFLWGCSASEGARILCGKYGVKLAMVTMGADGAYLMNRRAAVFAPCPAVEVVDTTGAGDIFGGSAISRILKTGKAPEDLDEEELMGVAAFAVAAASLSTQRNGGIPSIPSEEEVKLIV